MKRRVKIYEWGGEWRLSSQRLSNRRPGISLLFAMTIVTISFIIMVGSIDLATSTVQNTRATSYRLDAYYGALSGLEQAGWTVAEQSADYEVTGYETDGDLDDATSWELPIEIDTNGDGDYDDPGDSTTYYYIAGQSGEIDGYDYLYNPRPGTGTAGSDCSIFEPPTDEDDPCAWNKLDIGNIVSIPLYYSNTAGTDIENPSSNSGDWTSFELYIRTPCGWDGSSCMTNGEAGGGSDVIVNWEVVADCDGITNGCYLIPHKSSSGTINSYIYETNISNTTPVLQNDIDSKGEDQEGVTYKTVKTFITQSTITKPVLHLSIIDTWSGSSYLEYQLRTKDEDTKTANANITLVAKGYGGPTQGFEQTLTRTLGRSTNVIQFVFNN